MLFRSCAGGIVFSGEDVFLLLNEKEEWVLPKGVIRPGMLSSEVALRRVEAECGISAHIISTAGETSYEFYSITRRQPVCNEIAWYIMQADGRDFCINTQLGFKDGGWFGAESMLERITYSQDRSLVRLAAQKRKALADTR